jgi:hypothetical protein
MTYQTSAMSFTHKSSSRIEQHEYTFSLSFSLNYIKINQNKSGRRVQTTKFKMTKKNKNQKGI